MFQVIKTYFYSTSLLSYYPFVWLGFAFVLLYFACVTVKFIHSKLLQLGLCILGMYFWLIRFTSVMFDVMCADR